MKILYMGVLLNTSRPAVELNGVSELGDFSRFTRGTIAQFVKFYSKTVAERTKPGQRQSVTEEGYLIHSYGRSEGVCGIIITDQEYPQMVAHQLLSRVLDEFLTKHPISTFSSQTQDGQVAFPELKEYITKYQNPENADSIMKIQKELDETTAVLRKTIDQVLDRGEKIETLADKSNDLVGNSAGLFKQAKKQNSCCTVM